MNNHCYEQSTAGKDIKDKAEFWTNSLADMCPYTAKEWGQL